MRHVNEAPCTFIISPPISRPGRKYEVPVRKRVFFCPELVRGVLKRFIFLPGTEIVDVLFVRFSLKINFEMYPESESISIYANRICV